MINNVQFRKEMVRPPKVKNHESKIVGVLYEYTVGAINTHDIFSFDYGRLIDTIAHQKEVIRKVGAEYVRKTLRFALIDAMEHRVEDSPENLEFIRTIVINWLSTYNTPRKFISKAPNDSVGIVFSVNDLQEDPLMCTSGFNVFLTVLQKLNNNIKNLN